MTLRVPSPWTTPWARNDDNGSEEGNDDNGKTTVWLSIGIRPWKSTWESRLIFDLF